MLWVLPYWNTKWMASFGRVVGNKGRFGFVWYTRFLGPTIQSYANWVRLVKDSLQMKQLLGSFGNILSPPCCQPITADRLRPRLGGAISANGRHLLLAGAVGA